MLIIDLVCPVPAYVDLDIIREKIAQLMFEEGVISRDAQRSLGATGPRPRSGSRRRNWMGKGQNRAAVINTVGKIKIDVQAGDDFSANIRQIERPGGDNFWSTRGNQPRSTFAQRILGILNEETKRARNRRELLETTVQFTDEWRSSIMDIAERPNYQPSHNQHRFAAAR